MTAFNSASPPMTAVEFLKLDRHGDPSLHRELIRGEIWESAEKTLRSPIESEAIARIGSAFLNWLDSHPEVVGTVGGGEARCRLLTDSESVVGLDVAFFEGATFVNRPFGEDLFDGPPVIAVEVLSASDTHEDVSRKIDLYLEGGVKQVWIANPDYRTVTVYRKSNPPEMFAEGRSLTGGAELPGFSVQVSRLFGSR
jgi:Uma2 family endonuclease